VMEVLQLKSILLKRKTGRYLHILLSISYKNNYKISLHDFELCNEVLVPHCSVVLIVVGKLLRKIE
jgi:hypothetical protein